MGTTAFDLEDDGLISAEVDGVTFSFDLYRVHNDFIGIARENAGKPANDYLEAVRAYMVKQFGLPESITLRLVARFLDKENELVEGLKKKDADELKQESPDSTVSIPSP